MPYSCLYHIPHSYLSDEQRLGGPTFLCFATLKTSGNTFKETSWCAKEVQYTWEGCWWHMAAFRQNKNERWPDVWFAKWKLEKHIYRKKINVLRKGRKIINEVICSIAVEKIPIIRMETEQWQRTIFFGAARKKFVISYTKFYPKKMKRRASSLYSDFENGDYSNEREGWQ